MLVDKGKKHNRGVSSSANPKCASNSGAVTQFSHQRALTIPPLESNQSISVSVSVVLLSSEIKAWIKICLYNKMNASLD